MLRNFLRYARPRGKFKERKSLNSRILLPATVFPLARQEMNPNARQDHSPVVSCNAPGCKS
jgi:hypothetical protein